MKKLPRDTKDRKRLLVDRRNLKMARSAQTYIRGTTAKFYEWLQSVAGRKVPSGPPIWICGDCHLSNLGPLADADGHVEIEIRDLDQTVIGNPAHDLLRLGLSLATAARGSDLSGVTTARMLAQVIAGYEQGLRQPARRARKAARTAKPVEHVLEKALSRKWGKFAKELIENVHPTIPLGKCFWPLSKTEKLELERLFDREDVRKLVTRLRQRNSDDPIKIADAAFWMKGCSSLGHLRYAVVVTVGKKNKGSQGMCLIDIKEAAKACAPHAAGTTMPRDNAERIVKGAQSLSPFLGDRMLAARIDGRAVIIRELRPQDLKVELSEIGSEEAIATAHFLAEIVGKAHGRQMNSTTRREWLSELKRHRPTNKTSSWLWKSVVELLAIHEQAYLEHCRSFALQAGQVR